MLSISQSPTPITSQYELDGYFLLQNVYNTTQLGKLQERMSLMTTLQTNSIRHRDGDVYAARNVLDLCPEIADLWKTPALVDILLSILGDDACLVRGLFFDKPPTSSWGLPWHKDLLIAIQPPDVPSRQYSTPRDRLGVLHCEPPLSVLDNMLTIRIHLDEVTDENGPLEVAPGSHSTGKTLHFDPLQTIPIQTSLGGVLFMHRLLAHASGRSHPETIRHRRILHLEFTATPHLPDNYHWYQSFPVTSD